MTDNLVESQSVKSSIIIEEINKKTRNNLLSWSQTSPTTYTATMDSYSFYLTKTASTTYALTVMKSHAYYAIYNSLTTDGIADLYSVVDIYNASTQQYANLWAITHSISQIARPNTSDLTVELIPSGVLANGSGKIDQSVQFIQGTGGAFVGGTST